MSVYKQPLPESVNSPTHVRRLRRKARNLADAGRVAEAIDYQRALVAIVPNDFETLMQLGFMHKAVREIDDAVRAFRKASGVAPHTPDPHEVLAEIYLDEARYDDAIIECKALLRLMPRSISAREVISAAYFQMGLIDKALDAMTEVVRLAPADPLAHFKRGMLHQHKGDWGNALHEFTRAAEMAAEGTPDHNEARFAIEALDQHQIHQIMQLADEDTLFAQRLIRDPEVAARERGYFLSPDAASFVAQVASERLEYPETPFLGGASSVTSRRPQRYN